MYRDKIEKIRQLLVERNLDAILISSHASIVFLTGYANFSKDEREAYIFIGKNFGYIITDGRYSQSIKKEVSHLELFERGSGKSTTDLFKKYRKNVQVLGIEEDDLTVLEFKSINKHFKNLKHFDVNQLRSVKNLDEIKKVENACQIGDLAYDYILKKIKAGVLEKEIAWQLEKFIKGRDAEFSFPAIVAFGKNSSIPHHHTGNDILREGQIILLDFGVKFQNYCSDMTRSVVFGKLSQKQKNIYDTVLMAQQKAVEFINSSIKNKKQIKAGEVDKAARDYIISKGFPSIPHSLGHGIGLEVHEYPYLSPRSKEVLKEGMIFSIEPGIYVPDFGGVRIEDVYVYETEQLRKITTSPNNLIKV